MKKAETKIIRLSWDSDGESTFEDYVVPKNTPNEAIRIAIDLALATREDECETFRVLLTKMGYPTKVACYVAEKYDFNGAESEILDNIVCDDYALAMKIASKLKKATVKNKEALFLEKLNEIDCEEKEEKAIRKEILNITL